jgi:hypothetical protein
LKKKRQIKLKQGGRDGDETFENKVPTRRSIATMAAPPLVHAAVLGTFLVLLLLPTAIESLAVKGNLMQDFVTDVFSREVKPQGAMDIDRGAAVLKQLNLTSSTEPKPFYAQPQQLPSLLTASMVVRRSLFDYLSLSNSCNTRQRRSCLT